MTTAWEWAQIIGGWCVVVGGVAGVLAGAAWVWACALKFIVEVSNATEKVFGYARWRNDFKRYKVDRAEWNKQYEEAVAEWRESALKAKELTQK